MRRILFSYVMNTYMNIMTIAVTARRYVVACHCATHPWRPPEQCEGLSLCIVKALPSLGENRLLSASARGMVVSARCEM